MNVSKSGWKELAAVGLLSLHPAVGWAEEKVSAEMETLRVEARTKLLLKELEDLQVEVQSLRSDQ